MTPDGLLTDLLRDVSRAFYLTLRVLPGGVREPVGLAYLLARAADTIADTPLLPPAERLRHLLAFRAELERADSQARLLVPQQEHRLDLGSLPGGETRNPEGGASDAAERRLLRALPQAFALLDALAPDDRRRVVDIVVTLTRGMEMDLTTFPAEDSGRIGALAGASDLDTYVYHVAGCVGEFWTRVTVAHTPALQRWDAAKMADRGVRFGKALQLTNVLRDVPRDLRTGRCYLPEDELRAAGLAPRDLLDPTRSAAARPVLQHWLDVALGHYDAAEAYLLAIPRRCVRLRLAVLWPILMGLATLALVAEKPTWLDPDRPAKVTRRRVYRMLALSLPGVFSNVLLRMWIRALRRRVMAGAAGSG